MWRNIGEEREIRERLREEKLCRGLWRKDTRIERERKRAAATVDRNGRRKMLLWWLPVCYLLLPLTCGRWRGSG